MGGWRGRPGVRASSAASMRARAMCRNVARARGIPVWNQQSCVRCNPGGGGWRHRRGHLMRVDVGRPCTQQTPMRAPPARAEARGRPMQRNNVPRRVALTVLSRGQQHVDGFFGAHIVFSSRFSSSISIGTCNRQKSRGKSASHTAQPRLDRKNRCFLQKERKILVVVVT
jgi:hypothetical protein